MPQIRESFYCPGDIRFNELVGNGNAVGWAYDSYAVTKNVAWAGNYQKATQIQRPANLHGIWPNKKTPGAQCRNFYHKLPQVRPRFPARIVIFAIFGGNIGTFSFVDGYLEPHKWTDPQILAAGKSAHSIPGVQLYEYTKNGVPQNYSPYAPLVPMRLLILHDYLTPSNP